MPLDIHQQKQLRQLELRANSGQFARGDGQLVQALIATHIELFNLLRNPDATLDDFAPFLWSEESDTARNGADDDHSGPLPEGRDE